MTNQAEVIVCTAALRAAGIPARLALADVRDHLNTERPMREFELPRILF